jgi:protein-S-isoprenylcysteine O-methyltransferase Ste14
MYLGFLLVLIGWGVALANAGALALVPAFGCYLTRFQIRSEESALLEKFGDAARDYFAAVPRWL